MDEYTYLIIPLIGLFVALIIGRNHPRPNMLLLVALLFWPAAILWALFPGQAANEPSEGMVDN